jgi:hypothetical protein
MPETEIGFEQLKQLLLLMCRYPYDEKEKVVLSGLLGEVRDWHKMTELINAHGIIALAAYNIREAGLEKSIPEDAMAALDNGRMQSVVRNSWLTERWKEVNTILCDGGIKHVLLKGMALEHTLYGGKGLRQMNDNDILIKRDDALKAWYLLQDNGFSPELIKSPLHKKIMMDIGKHLPSLYKNGYAVEIHHKLFNKNFNAEMLTENPVDDAVEINISDTKAWILPKQIHLIYLRNHFEKHASEGSVQLRQYADIILLDTVNKITMPDSFILKPQQENNPGYIKAAYKISVNSIKPKLRFRYVLGDIFPSVEWMRKRYKCKTLKALLYYPPRIGKALWLI